MTYYIAHTVIYIYRCMLLTTFYLVDPHGACAKVIVVALCVCLSVTTYSLTTHGFSPNKAYQKIQRDAGKKPIFVKMFCSKVMA